MFTYQTPVLLFVILLTALHIYFIGQLKYDYDIEQLFPKNDPELQFHKMMKDKFSFHQDYLILGIENEKGIFNHDFLPRLDTLVKRLTQHRLIKKINAPTNLRYFFKTAWGLKSLPFLHPHDQNRYERDSIFLHSYGDVAPKFISKYHTAVNCFIFLTEALTKDDKEEVQSFINQNIAALGFDKHHLYGDIYAKGSYIKELESEMYNLSIFSIFIIIVILFFSFRSFFGVAIPVLIVALTTIWTMGTFALLGVSINMMTVLVPTIVSIISLSDVIHVMNHFQEQQFSSKKEAIMATFKDMRWVILLTSFTTGLGFITLSFSTIQPFIEFGIFTAIGVIYAYFLAIFVLPLLLNLTNIDLHKKQVTLNFIPVIYRFIHTNPRTIIVSGSLILFISLMGISKLKVNSYLYEELSSKDTFSETLHFFEHHFSGIRTFTLHLAVVDTTKTVLDQAVLTQIDQLENYLLKTYGLTTVYSITTPVKRANRVMKAGEAGAFVLPKDKHFLKFLTDQVLKNRKKSGLQSILSQDKMEAKITGKMKDVGSAEIRKRNEALNQFIATELTPSLTKTTLTGSTLLLDKSNKIITYKVLYGLLFAVMLVSILMGLLYKSIKITLIAIIPNLLPLIMILGIIGWTNMGLKMSTVIIFTIAFGIAVDDTIHFMNRLNNELKKGKIMTDAIQATYFSTGKAIIITSFILILGFGVLLFSAFQTTFITGLLVSLALIFALLADLILLPVLLRVCWDV